MPCLSHSQEVSSVKTDRKFCLLHRWNVGQYKHTSLNPNLISYFSIFTYKISVDHTQNVLKKDMSWWWTYTVAMVPFNTAIKWLQYIFYRTAADPRPRLWEQPQGQQSPSTSTGGGYKEWAHTLTLSHTHTNTQAKTKWTDSAFSCGETVSNRNRDVCPTLFWSSHRFCKVFVDCCAVLKERKLDMLAAS